VPISAAAINEAIALNGVAVEANRAAFHWGRRYVVDGDAVLQAAGIVDAPRAVTTLDEVIARREEHLGAYQDAAYARRYRALVDRVRRAEGRTLPGRQDLADTIARNYAKLLAYKDEYEVARLHTDAAFGRALEAEFEGNYRLQFHLAPPLLARRDPHTGIPRKRAFGAWILPLFKVLARMKGLRGSAFDPFGYGAERRAERALIGEYERTVEELLDGLCQANYDDAVAIADLPDAIRGFGHVKRASIERTRMRREALLQSFRNPAQRAAA
jgi:indolepyruvate ferredoxin oxidoreductase